MNEQVTQKVRAINREFSDATLLMHEAIARKAGLSGADHKYLGLLINQGAMTAGEFAKMTGLTTGAVTGLIDRLERKNLAKRKFDKTDRRKVYIIPNTENAMKLLGPLFAELQERTTSLIASLSESEIQIIEKYLLAAIAIMNDVKNNINNR